VKKWEGVKSDDEDCEIWANGGTGHIMKRQDQGRGFYIMKR
jgi:hypothetical protein